MSVFQEGKRLISPIFHGCQHDSYLLPLASQFTRREGSVPNVRVRGQLTYLEVKWENKKKDCKLCMCMYLHVVSHTHDVNMHRSIKTSVIVVRGLNV
jgi:hypothetical protein